MTTDSMVVIGVRKIADVGDHQTAGLRTLQGIGDHWAGQHAKPLAGETIASLVVGT